MQKSAEIPFFYDFTRPHTPQNVAKGREIPLFQVGEILSWHILG